MVGYEPFTYYCYQQLYDADGNPIQNAFVDRDEDGVISEGDLYMTGKSINPDFFYGINFKVSYKNWDFGFNGHGSVGGWAFNDFNSSNSTSNVDVNAGNLPNLSYIVNKTKFTKANSKEQWYSDYFLENASFFRLDDVSLGYTFRSVGRWETDVRLGLVVQNVFVLTGYSGMDPEVISETGIDNVIWPRPRTYSFRVNVNF
jgi:iron complex outermembrane receptor protein